MQRRWPEDRGGGKLMWKPLWPREQLGHVWKFERGDLNAACCRGRAASAAGWSRCAAELKGRKKKSWLDSPPPHLLSPPCLPLCPPFIPPPPSMYRPHLTVSPQIQRRTSPAGWRRSSGGPSSLRRSARPHLGVTPPGGDRSNTTPGYVAPSGTKSWFGYFWMDASVRAAIINWSVHWKRMNRELSLSQFPSKNVKHLLVPAS